VVGITLDDLRKIPRVIGIAGGKQKAMSILGALRGSYLDVLVTDERTADYLISQGR
jgi:DNA-binding transcriptional regulator LsrR (DeoR family)